MIIGISGKIGSGKDTIGTIIKYLIVENQRKADGRESLGKFNPEWVYNTYEEVNFQVKKFADKLKDMVCLLIGCTREQLEDRKFKETELGEEWWYFDSIAGKMAYRNTLDTNIKLVKLTPRKLLQLLGTEAGRNIIHPNIWINALMNEYKVTESYRSASVRFTDNGWRSDNGPKWVITDMRFPNELKAIKSRGGVTVRVNRFDGLTAGQIAYEKPHPSEVSLDDAEFDWTIQNDGTMEDLVESVREFLSEFNII